MGEEKVNIIAYLFVIGKLGCVIQNRKQQQRHEFSQKYPKIYQMYRKCFIFMLYFQGYLWTDYLPKCCNFITNKITEYRWGNMLFVGKFIQNFYIWFVLFLIAIIDASSSSNGGLECLGCNSVVYRHANTTLTLGLLGLYCWLLFCLFAFFFRKKISFRFVCFLRKS